MDEVCGELFEKATKENRDLIDFEFGFNNFKLDQVISLLMFNSLQVRAIQDNLIRNKRKYDEDRLREWRERKLMNAEDVELTKLYFDEQSHKFQLRMEEEAKESKQKEIEEEWRKLILDNEIEK